MFNFDAFPEFDDSDPFDEPIGPTPYCLSSRRMLELSAQDLEHIAWCYACKERMERFRKVYIQTAGKVGSELGEL